MKKERYIDFLKEAKADYEKSLKLRPAKMGDEKIVLCLAQVDLNLFIVKYINETKRIIEKINYYMGNSSLSELNSAKRDFSKGLESLFASSSKIDSFIRSSK